MRKKIKNHIISISYIDKWRMAQPLLFQMVVSEGSVDILATLINRVTWNHPALTFEMGCHA